MSGLTFVAMNASIPTPLYLLLSCKSSLQSKLMKQATLSTTNSTQPIIRSGLTEKRQQILSDLIKDPKELVQLLALAESLSLASAVTLLGNSALGIVLVLHCNHTQGLSPKLSQDLSLLTTNALLLLYKSVLLSEINNNYRILTDLSSTIATKVLPKPAASRQAYRHQTLRDGGANRLPSRSRNAAVSAGLAGTEADARTSRGSC